jgi:hypothetical protein
MPRNPALKARFIFVSGTSIHFDAMFLDRSIKQCVESRLQRSAMRDSNPWGVAPGSDEIAPLALNVHTILAKARRVSRIRGCR